MTSLLSLLRAQVRRRQRGQTMTEYALILGAVAVVVFAIYHIMGQDIVKLWTNVTTNLTSIK